MTAATKQEPPIYGYLAEYEYPEPLLAAAKAARAEGFQMMECYTPMPVHGLSDVLGYKNKVATLVLIGGITGLLVGFGLCYWVSVMRYPLDIGGRPFNSWPAFVVPAFETTILFASLTAVFGMLALNGLPQPYHPLFNVPRFNEATRSRFFLLIAASDPKFDMTETREFLAGLAPVSVTEVPH
jgi:hypothetical protein